MQSLKSETLAAPTNKVQGLPSFAHKKDLKMGDVLCIFCYHHVLILDMELILSDEDYEERTPPQQPPLKRCFDFVENGLPLGMGLLKSGNFLYMFGGEYPNENSYRKRKKCHETGRFPYIKGPVMGRGIPKEQPPCPVFMLDLTNNESKPIPLPSMLGPKIYAIVVEIGGKIFVLSDRPLFCNLPEFEVWNPIAKEWRALPKPPSFSNGDMILCHCVCDRDIICHLYSESCRFNTVSETWECLVGPRQLRAVSGRFDVQGVYVGYRRGCNDLCASIDRPEEEDDLYVEVDSFKPLPCVPGYKVMTGSILADTSELGEYMCGLLPYFGSQGLLIYVFVFQVVLELESPTPLSIRFLRNQLFDFTFLKDRGKEEFPIFFLSNAVIGSLSQYTSSGSLQQIECSWGEANREADDDDQGIIALEALNLNT